MKQEDCFLFGKISKTKGLKGELIVFLETDQPETYIDLELCYLLIGNQLVPFEIYSWEMDGKYAVAKFDGIENLDAALKLVRKTVHLPLSFLPQLSGKSFYFHELIDFEVWECNDKKNIGKVNDFLDYPGNLLFSVMSPDGKEILLPSQDHFIHQIDRKEKKIWYQAPEGLIDLYIC